MGESYNELKGKKELKVDGKERKVEETGVADRKKVEWIRTGEEREKD